MADKIDATEQFLTTLNTAMNSVGKAMVDIAPDVAKATLAAVQLNGIANLIIGLLIMGISIGFARLCFLTTKHPWGEDCEPTRAGVFGVLSGIMATILFLVALFVYLVNIYYWISAFSPEAGLAYKILQKVL